MEIILVRHGKPISATNEVMDSVGFAYWVKRYHHSGVSDDSRPKWQLDSKANNAYLVSSDLKRAKESALIAFNRTPSKTIIDLNEMDIPRYLLPVKLNAWTWVYLSRALWILGKSGKFESYADAKMRAEKAANQLVELAHEHDLVVSVGHGFLNLYMRRYLRKKGWVIHEKNNDYWGVSRLTYNY